MPKLLDPIERRLQLGMVERLKLDLLDLLQMGILLFRDFDLSQWNPFSLRGREPDSTRKISATPLVCGGSNRHWLGFEDP